MNFCMVIDWIGAGNKTPDAAQLCMFYSAPPASSTQAALTYYEFRTSLEIKDAVENFCLILMDMFQERDFFRGDLRDDEVYQGPDSIHHVIIDYQVRSIEAQLNEFTKLCTNGDNEHMEPNFHRRSWSWRGKQSRSPKTKRNWW